MDESLQANMGHGVTGFGLLCFPLLTLALFGVCGCLCGFGVARLAFLGTCFFNMAKTGNFIRTFYLECNFLCDYYFKMLFINKIKPD